LPDKAIRPNITLALVLLPASFLAGLTLEQFAIAWDVSIQEHVPPEKLARVYSYDSLGTNTAIPLGQVLAGPLAVALGARPALLLASGVSVLAVVVVLGSRSVRTLVHRQPVVVPAQA
jgi:MFS family permease